MSKNENNEIIDEAICQMSKLEARLKSAAEQYSQIKESCESKVVEWRWATAEMNNLKLLNNERGRYPRGRWAKTRPKKTENRVEYGLDVDDRTTVIRKGIMLTDVAHHKKFFSYGDDLAESVEFDSMFTNPHVDGDKSELVRVVRQSLLDGIPISCTWYAGHQRGYETYEYKSGQLVSIDSTWTNQPHRVDDVLSAICEVSYDDDGSLALVTIDYRPVGHHKGGKFTCFKKKRPK